MGSVSQVALSRNLPTYLLKILLQAGNLPLEITDLLRLPLVAVFQLVPLF